MIIWYL